MKNVGPNFETYQDFEQINCLKKKNVKQNFRVDEFESCGKVKYNLKKKN